MRPVSEFPTAACGFHWAHRRYVVTVVVAAGVVGLRKLGIASGAPTGGMGCAAGVSGAASFASPMRVRRVEFQCVASFAFRWPGFRATSQVPTRAVQSMSVMENPRT